MLAFLRSSSATKRSLSDASGSFRMLASCCRWPGLWEGGQSVSVEQARSGGGEGDGDKPEKVGDVAHGLKGEPRDGLILHMQDLTAAHSLCADQSTLRPEQLPWGWGVGGGGCSTLAPGGEHNQPPWGG